MVLKAKIPKKPANNLIKSLEKPIRRMAYVSDKEMKRLKITAITKETTIQVLLANVLDQLLKQKPKELIEPDTNQPKRSFSIDSSQIQALKLYAANNSVSQDKVIYNAVLMVIR